MSISIIVIIIQIVPVVYLMYWGYANNKISEYLIWIKLVCGGRKKSADKVGVGGLWFRASN